MSSMTPLETVQSFFSGFVAGPEVWRPLVADGATVRINGPGGKFKGVYPFAEWMLGADSHRRIVGLEDLRWFESDDTVLVTCVLTFSFPATGLSYEDRNVGRYTVRDGQIVDAEAWYSDHEALAAAMGLVPGNGPGQVPSGGTAARRRTDSR